MSPELANAKVRGMARERHGIARVRYVVDWFRDLGFLGKPDVETKAAKDIAAFEKAPR